MPCGGRKCLANGTVIGEVVLTSHLRPDGAFATFTAEGERENGALLAIPGGRTLCVHIYAPPPLYTCWARVVGDGGHWPGNLKQEPYCAGRKQAHGAVAAAVEGRSGWLHVAPEQAWHSCKLSFSVSCVCAITLTSNHAPFP